MKAWFAVCEKDKECWKNRPETAPSADAKGVRVCVGATAKSFALKNTRVETGRKEILPAREFLAGHPLLKKRTVGNE